MRSRARTPIVSWYVLLVFSVIYRVLSISTRDKKRNISKSSSNRMNNHWLKYQVTLNFYLALIKTNKEYPAKYYQGMGIFTPGEQRNMEYLKLKYSPSTPDLEPLTLLSPYL